MLKLLDRARLELTTPIPYIEDWATALASSSTVHRNSVAFGRGSLVTIGSLRNGRVEIIVHTGVDTYNIGIRERGGDEHIRYWLVESFRRIHQRTRIWIPSPSDLQDICSVSDCLNIIQALIPAARGMYLSGENEVRYPVGNDRTVAMRGRGHYILDRRGMPVPQFVTTRVP